MPIPDIYFVDLHIIYQIFSKNIWYIFKLLAMSYIMFYWVPTKIFPQDYTGEGIKKIVFNFVYMIAYVELVFTVLLFTKTFSIFFFIFILFITKLGFMRLFYKIDLIEFFDKLGKKIIHYLLNVLDKNLNTIKKDIYAYIYIKIEAYQKGITLYSFLKTLLFFSVFLFIISILASRGLSSYADPLPDTSQFIERINYYGKNIFFPDGPTFGADFYGIPILIFFIHAFTNIDPIILFSIYPILVLMGIYFSIYYVIKEFTNSQYISLFAVMFHGLVLMTPLSDIILGQIITTSSPDIVNWYGLKFYLPKATELLEKGEYIGFIPYIRYISGMAYEHASIFVFLNIFFLIKSLEEHKNSYIFIYFLTLMLVFTMHGGGAIVLIVISILVAINAIFFKKINLTILKKGLKAVFGAAILGNIWILSMIKYGLPQDFGAAAPILDKLLGTKRNLRNILKEGFENVKILDLGYLHIELIFILILAFVLVYFTRKKFLNSSFILIALGIFLLYFGPNADFPLLTSQTRLAEYLFFALTILFSFYYIILIYKPIYKIFPKYAKILLLIIGYLQFILLSLFSPKWIKTDLFWQNLNDTGYTSIPDTIVKISKSNRPFTWTVISYVQEFAKVSNKAYHINTQNFLLQFNPNDKNLKIATKKIYIFVENFAHPYKGMGEWYYRWRDKIQEDLKSWIVIYGMNHNNLKLYAKTKTITVYEIDNTEYMEELKKKELNEHFRTK